MNRRRLLVLILTAAALYGHRLESPDFWGRHWESRRALIARAMLEDGDWLVPSQNGDVTLNKPPLYYWTMAGSMAAAGRTERGARLPSVFAAIAGLVLTWRVAIRLGGEGAGFWAVYFLAVNPLYWGHARTAEMDMLLLAVELAAVWAFLRARDGSRAGPWLGWAFTAAGFLIKGPVGIVVPVAVILVYAVADRRRGRPGPTGWVRPGRGIALFLALVLPWFITVLFRVPGAADVFWLQALGRYRGELDHLEPFWFYGPVLLGGFLPGTLFLPLWFRHLRGSGSPGHLRRLGIVLLVLLVFFSISGSKRVYYILPLWPLLAIGMGMALNREGGGRRLAVPAAILAGGLGAAAIAVGVLPSLGGSAFYAETPAAFAVLGGMAGMGAAGVILAVKGRWRSALVAVGLVLAGALGFTVDAVYPVSNAYRSRAAFARDAAAAAPPGEPLVMFRQDNFAVPFYADRVVPNLRDPQAVRDSLAAHPRLFVILDPRQARRLDEAGFRVTDRMCSRWIPPGRDATPRDLSLVTIESSGNALPGKAENRP